MGTRSRQRRYEPEPDRAHAENPALRDMARLAQDGHLSELTLKDTAYTSQYAIARIRPRPAEAAWSASHLKTNGLSSDFSEMFTG